MIRLEGGEGKEAMASGRSSTRLARLWQLPLLVFSLILFGYAAYLFIDPKPGLTIEQKIDVARVYLKYDRPQAAIEHLNRLLNTERLERLQEGTIHLLLAESLEVGQKQKHLNNPVNHQRIIEQTQIALSQGVQADATMLRRLGDSYGAIDRPAEALQSYRQAIALDQTQSIRLLRKVIELQVAQADAGPAEVSLDRYLAIKELTDSERAWAQGEKAQLLIDAQKYMDARTLLSAAMKMDLDPVSQGQFQYRMGYCAWKLNEIEEAERSLRLARDLLRIQHPLDADAAYALGRIYQDRNDPAQANSFYQAVLVSHPGSRVAPLSQLGRGVCRIMQGEDDAGLTDLHDLVASLSQRASRQNLKDETINGLKQAAGLLSAKANYQGALEVMDYELQLRPEPQAGFYARLAVTYEKRAEQIERSIPDASPADRIRRTQQVCELRSRAGDAYVTYSRALVLTDDKGYGEAMWRGVDLYDRAGAVQRVISALELFSTERPNDSLAPDALLRLGRAYQAAGLFDKAIAVYQKNQFRYPQSLAASKSAVPLAQAYIAKGPECYGMAERVLLGIVNNNPLLTPEAEEFKQSLFELAQLYYRTGRFEESIARLEESTQRYPKEERMPQFIFLMADSYRKSANLLDMKVATAENAAAQAAEAVNAKRSRLSQARTLYDRTIELYRLSPPGRDLDKLYQKLSHFYRADCLYDLGKYDEAIRLYDAAAFRYQEDPSALAAYVQIVNAYCALGKLEEAKTANERAKWLLRRMPPESFQDGTFAMPKVYWEQWLKWTSDAGMW